jgi:hypothetical protein
MLGRTLRAQLKESTLVGSPERMPERGRQPTAAALGGRDSLAGAAIARGSLATGGALAVKARAPTAVRTNPNGPHARGWGEGCGQPWRRRAEGGEQRRRGRSSAQPARGEAANDVLAGGVAPMAGEGASPATTIAGGYSGG